MIVIHRNKHNIRIQITIMDNNRVKLYKAVLLAVVLPIIAFILDKDLLINNSRFLELLVHLKN